MQNLGLTSPKWNPVEHKLFSFISINWAGKPLRSYELMLGYINSTTTESGLQVRAEMILKEFDTGKKVSNKEMDMLNIEKHSVCPLWNYTIRPNKN